MTVLERTLCNILRRLMGKPTLREQGKREKAHWLRQLVKRKGMA